MDTEEAIEILKDKDCFWQNTEEKVLTAIEIVLQDYNRLEEENRTQREKLKSFIQEMRKNGSNYWAGRLEKIIGEEK